MVVTRVNKSLFYLVFSNSLLLVIISNLIGFCQITDADALAIDIPEPPSAKNELPSPIPVVYEFMSALLAGDYDKCLQNFDVATFLMITFGKSLNRLTKQEYQEVYAYQVQVQRNELRFLSRVMHRLARNAKIDYSNPRYHKNVQAKIVVNLNTIKGKHVFEIYCRYANSTWQVYDYVLNGQRLTKKFIEGLGNLKIDGYVASLRPFYDNINVSRVVKNDNFGISFKVPSRFQVRENVAPTLLASISGIDGHFLLHLQGAEYAEPITLTQVAHEIKNTIMPFKPKIYDQWKTDIAGVDIGNVLFQFEKNGKILYAHMVIIPMGRKLVVMNFYHSSLVIMKNMTNIRDRILESLSLTKIESKPVEVSLPGEDLGLPDSDNNVQIQNAKGDLAVSNNQVVKISAPQDYQSAEIPPPTDEPPEIPPPDSEPPEIPPPDEDQPQSYSQPHGWSGYNDSSQPTTDMQELGGQQPGSGPDTGEILPPQDIGGDAGGDNVEF